MKVRLITRFGDGLPLLSRMQQEGAEVSFWAEQPAVRRSFRGMIRQETNPLDGLDGTDLTLFDCTGLGKLAESCKGYGGSGLADSLECDRAFSLRVAKAGGMLVPENHVCTTMAEIQALTQADHRLWVFKPATSQPAVYAFAPSTKDEQTDFVQYLGQKELSPLMLQERVKGVDLAIGCYYYGGEPILSTVHSALEFRRFMNGNIGPAVGSSGCVAWYWKVLPAKLWNATHAKMMPFLKRFGYTGPLTIRTCISDKDQMPWFLEAVCRVNGCVTEALAEVSPIPLSDFFLDAARDRLRDFKPSYDWAGCVRVSTPPYPASVDASLSEGKPLSDLDPSDPHIWPMDIEKTGNGYCTAGVDGAVCDVTAKSQTIADVGKQILDRCERIVLLDKQYRTDLGDCAHHRMDKLREWKYIR